MLPCALTCSALAGGAGRGNNLINQAVGGNGGYYGGGYGGYGGFGGGNVGQIK